MAMIYICEYLPRLSRSLVLYLSYFGLIRFNGDYDGVVEKTTFAVFLSYILFVKRMDAYLTSIFGISLVLLVLMIDSSDRYSRRE